MTDIGRLCQRVYGDVEWQKMPLTMSTSDKAQMITNAVMYAIQDLFVVTGRANTYSTYAIVYDEDTGLESEFGYDLMLDEELYVLCKAKVEIFGKVRTQYNDLLGYTTNALTVTNADKPYAYVTGTMDELNKQLRLYYYKMTRYSHLT